MAEPAPARGNRTLTYADALCEALDLKMAEDTSVYLIGEGVADPKAIFGTTRELLRKYGPDRVVEMPVSENGMTGVAIGSAIAGQRPVMTHQRVDFMMLALDQIANNAAKLRYLFNGKLSVPLVIRAIIGRGWGQSAQHAQSLEATFAHFPGLKVAMPATAYDAKGMLIAAIEDNDPVIFIEHRWLHMTIGEVPAGRYTVPLTGPRIARKGKDITIAATSYMVVEALRAAEALAKCGIDAEVIDIRMIRPLDTTPICDSVVRTGRLVIVDSGWRQFGVGAEIAAQVAERAFAALKAAPRRLGLPDYPAPASRALIERYYPDARAVAVAAGDMLSLGNDRMAHLDTALGPRNGGLPLDVPDMSFRGPF